MSEEKYVVPTATMNERPEDYELVFEVPGIGKGEADLHVENRSLMLKTHAQYQATVTAKLENGILRVVVRKRPETQARAIAIA